VLEFSELLADTPSRWSLRRMRTENYQQPGSNGDSNLRVLSERTISQHLFYLSELWEMVRADVQEFEASANPFRSGDLLKPPPQFPFGLNKRQVESLFKLPVFSAGTRPLGCHGEACYWIPLLLLWTGARPTEIAELMISDIRLIHGRPKPTLRLRNSRGPIRRSSQLRPEQDRPGGHRLVPIHSALLTLNFAGYVSWLSGLGHRHLFPGLNARASGRDPFASFGLWWSGYLQRHGRYPSGRRPATALQKHWASRARICGLSDETIDYVLGRKRALGADPNAFVSNAEMDRFQLERYDFASIERWQTPVRHIDY
jgi:integrase